MTAISFTVRGLPVPQGSSRVFVGKSGRAFVATEGNRTRSPLGAWRSAIATEARAVMGDLPCLEGPIALEVDFVMPRPRGHYRVNGQLKPAAPAWHSGRPDVDKLLRSLLDAITEVVIRDDSQVAVVQATKLYEQPLGELNVGAVIRIAPAAFSRGTTGA